MIFRVLYLVYALSNSYKKNEFTKITVLQVIFSGTIFFEVEPKTAIFLEKRLILCYHFAVHRPNNFR